MLAFLFYCFLAYILYRLLFGFIIPVYKATRQVKRSFRDMQQHMNQFSAQQQPPEEPIKPRAGKAVSGDYIDFEEVK